MGDWRETDFGRIPASWDLKRIADLKSKEKGAIAMGPFGSNIKAENFVPEGVPIIRGTNLNFDKYVGGDFVFLREEKADELKGSNCKAGDLVFTHRGTIGQVGLIPKKNYPRYVISQSGMKFTGDKTLIDSEYLFYFFKSKYGQHELLKNESQVGVPSISNPLSSLKEIQVPIPSLPEQEAIAEVLSSLDDKIDLLHRQNKTLESLAETLFRQWFIEEAEEKFPNGKTHKLSALIDTISETFKFTDDEVIFLNTSDIYEGAVITRELSNPAFLPGQAKKRIKRNDILYSEIRPANKRYAFIDFDSKNYVVSTKLMVLRAKANFSPAILYFYLTHPDTLEWLQMIAESRSGTFPQITFDQVKDLAINLPNDKRLGEVNDWAESAIGKISQNRQQITTLTRVRDSILPKLIRGEVRVANRGNN